MAPKRASKHQQQINVDQFKLLKKPMDHLGKQVNVPGSFWQGRMLPDERDQVYKCTIVDFSLAHKVRPETDAFIEISNLTHLTHPITTHQYESHPPQSCETHSGPKPDPGNRASV
jgi:hypothetical protein